MLAAVQFDFQTDPHAGMWALLKIAAAFVVMVMLIRRGVAIGYVLLIAAVLLGLAMGVGFAPAEPPSLAWALTGAANLAHTMLQAIVDPKSIRLLCLVLAVNVFGGVMKRVEKLKALSDSLLALLRDRRWAMGSLASLIGLLPMPGGAMLSAPMVGEMARDLDLTREDKTAINHWMRHVWEYVDPLYPGLLTAASQFSVPVTALMLWQLPFSVVSVVVGAVFLLNRVPAHQRRVQPQAANRALAPVVKAVGPVLVIVVIATLPQVVAMVIKASPSLRSALPGGAIWNDDKFFEYATLTFAEVCMLAALMGVIAWLLKANRIHRADGWRLVREGVTVYMVSLVLGICVLKGVLDASGTMRPITAFLQSTGVPSAVVVGSATFIVGAVLGYTYGFVAMCYPVLDLMLRTESGHVNFPLAAFAFAAGFLGVLLSPTHLCLVLSREHFGATWSGVYKRLIVPALLVLATGCLMLLLA